MTQCEHKMKVANPDIVVRDIWHTALKQMGLQTGMYRLNNAIMNAYRSYGGGWGLPIGDEFKFTQLPIVMHKFANGIALTSEESDWLVIFLPWPFFNSKFNADLLHRLLPNTYPDVD